uniref:NAC domain-containing protein n=1 Tax=Setaria viridis TaxID=4556 RepID=A0A4U6VC21_SETVI|nr:hypothetical protein SEVIR_4G124400v2 [Setaria viridis]
MTNNREICHSIHVDATKAYTFLVKEAPETIDASLLPGHTTTAKFLTLLLVCYVTRALLDQDEWVIARVFQKPGEVPPARKHRLGLSSAGGESCFSDSTSASIGGGGGGASASSAPRPLLPDASSLFAAAAAASADADSGSYCGAASGANGNTVVTGRELVPCFSTTTGPLDAALGIGQPYNPAPLAFEPPPPAFFSNLRSMPDNLQLPLFLSGGLSTGASTTLGPLGGGGFHWPAAGMEVKVEGRTAPQMAVGPGQLDGAFGWGF